MGVPDYENSQIFIEGLVILDVFLFRESLFICQIFLQSIQNAAACKVY